MAIFGQSLLTYVQSNWHLTWHLSNQLILGLEKLGTTPQCVWTLPTSCAILTVVHVEQLSDDRYNQKLSCKWGLGGIDPIIANPPPCLVSPYCDICQLCCHIHSTTNCHIRHPWYSNSLWGATPGSILLSQWCRVSWQCLDDRYNQTLKHGDKTV